MPFVHHYPNFEELREASKLSKIPAGSRGPNPVIRLGEFPPGFHETYPEGSFKYLAADKFSGTLYGEDGTLLNKNVRNRYYPVKTNEFNHVAKTPLHAVRWAIGAYTRSLQTVLDPFMGSGTTGAEALSQGRRTIGCELEFGDAARQTLEHFDPEGKRWTLYEGPAQEMLDNVDDESVHLVNFSNPYPDKGDHTVGRVLNKSGSVRRRIHRGYEHEDNAGLMRSGTEYWNLMETIQTKSCQKLKRDGHAVFVIKDMIKGKEVWPLHEKLADLLPDWMEFEGSAALPHYPATFAMSAYQNRFGLRPPMEQIILVFRKTV